MQKQAANAFFLGQWDDTAGDFTIGNGYQNTEEGKGTDARGKIVVCCDKNQLFLFNLIHVDMQTLGKKIFDRVPREE